MVTIHRALGLRVVIYLDDHEPGHVHVFGDGQAKINLAGKAAGPELVWAEGMTRSDGTSRQLSSPVEADPWLMISPMPQLMPR